MTVEFAEHAYIKKLEADFKRLHDIVGGMGFADMIQRIINLIAEVEKQDAEIERLKEDAERYRFLRDEDNWGCDNDETTESRWGDLGECHGGDFDAFVDKARAALAGKEDKP